MFDFIIVDNNHISLLYSLELENEMQRRLKQGEEEDKHLAMVLAMEEEKYVSSLYSYMNILSSFPTNFSIFI